LGQGGSGGGTYNLGEGFIGPGGAGGSGSVALSLTGAQYVHALARGYGGAGSLGGGATGTVAATSTTTGTQNAEAFLYLDAGSSGVYSSGVNLGMPGGTVTSGAATVTEATASGGTANALLKATGGAGGIGVGITTGVSLTTGGAGGTVSDLSATAYGFSARAVVIGTGGSGGGGAYAIGGAGGAVTLSNAVLGKSRGGYIFLVQEANGGTGGYGSYGAGGAGGAASSSLSVSDIGNPFAASTLTTYVSAAGGAGGGSASGTGGAGGAGGAASASNSSTSLNGGYAHAVARGGSAGSGATAGAGGNAQATASAAANGLAAAAKARATASATGGSGATQGTATASATTTTANGQASLAQATGDGATDNFTATASTAGSGVLLGLTNSAHVTGGGKMSTAAYAIVNGPTPAFIGSTDNAYSYADGDPTSAQVNSLVAGASKVAAVLGTSTTAVDLADGKQGAYESVASGSQSYTSSETFHVDTEHLSGDLVLGLLAPQASGTGLTDAKLTVTVGSGAAQVFNETSLAAAQAFFSDDALNLGTFSASANLAVTLSLSETFSGAGSGYAIGYLLGATGSGSLTLSVPGAQVLGVNKAGSIVGVSLAASGSTRAPETFTVALSDKVGELSVTANGATVTGNGTTSLKLTGLLTEVNAALASLTDTDAETGKDTVTLNASDSFGGSATQATIGITANGLPVLSVPGAQTLAKGVAKAITGVSLAESGSTGSPEHFTVTLTDTYGKLSVSTADGGTVKDDGSKSVTISGLLAQVDAALASLTDSDGANGADTITLNATDSFGNAAAEKTIAVTVTSSGAIRRFGFLGEPADHPTVTLQLLNQYAHQFGVESTDYSLPSDKPLGITSGDFSLEHAGNLESRHSKIAPSA